MVSNEIALIVLQVGLQEQPGHGNDAVHGRADFVTHVREKIRFGARFVFRSQARRLSTRDWARQFVQQTLAVAEPPGRAPQLGRVARFDDMVPMPRDRSCAISECSAVWAVRTIQGTRADAS